MAKTKTLTLLLALIFTAVTPVSMLSPSALSISNAQAEEAIQTNIEDVTQYEEQFSYIDILEAQYEDIVEYAEKCNVTLDEDITFNYYVDCYYAQNAMLASEFLTYTLEYISYLSTTASPVLESEFLSAEYIPSTMSSTTDLLYWEDIDRYENGLPFTPCYDYFLANFSPGDIVDECGFNDIGHTAIIEGWDSNFNCWTVIESLKNIGVCRSVIDNNRIILNKSVILRVRNTSQSQRSNAVNYCYQQIDDSYGNPLDGSKIEFASSWLCSTLVWAGYKQAGIDICPESNTCYPWDIADSSLMTTINCVRYDYLTFEITQRHPELIFYSSWSVNIHNPNYFPIYGYYNSRLCNESDAESFRSQSLTNETFFTTLEYDFEDVYIEHNGTAGYITAYYTLTLGEYNYKVITYANELTYSSGVGSCTEYHNIVAFE